MHTGDSFGPTVCKCMSCAEKRQQRTERETRIRYREAYNNAQQAIDEADIAYEEAGKRRVEAQVVKSQLMAVVRNELANEVGFNDALKGYSKYQLSDDLPGSY